MISFEEKYPEYAKNWDNNKNEKLPSEVSYGSGKKYWWKCEKGHSYLSSPNVISKGTQCPYCSGLLAIKGKTDLETTHPEILNIWNYERNNIEPSEVKAGSNIQVWWKCNKNHTWKAPIYRITMQKSGCPYCANQKVLAGFNDLETVYPEILEEWDYTKNEVKPNEVLFGSTKKVWWKCKSCGKCWEATISHRTGIHKTGCPECAKFKYRQTQLKNQIMKEGSLADKYPQLLKEWNYERNSISPDEIVSKSARKVHWKCEKGHEWEAIISSRTRVNGTGCPICAGKIVLEGFNDLKSQKSMLVKEWDYAKNKVINLHPEKTTCHSEKKAYWICPTCGKSYKAAICHRVDGTGCPECAKQMKTSFGEQTIYYYLSKVLKTENRWNDIGLEVDIFLPELNLGIEYDGELYHTGEDALKREEKKYNYLKKSGIKLIRVKENIKHNDLISYADLTIEIQSKRWDNEFETVIKKIVNFINMNWCLDLEIKVDIKRDRQDIYAQYIRQRKENSIVEKYPKLIQEWDYAKNKIKPESLTPGSSKIVWWKCENGHEWEAQINSRSRGSGCPYCSNQKVLHGFNDLLTKNPELAKEWNYGKNNGLTPDSIVYGSNKKVWWKCSKCNNEWQATLKDRSNGRGCPYCTNKKVKIGYNDLETAKFELLKEWDYEKNSLNPNMVTTGSHKRAFWICSKCGHKWSTEIRTRANRKNGCPKCRNKII